MNEAPSDALVIFGVTGDLAHRKILPALHALVRGGTLDIPVIGVARPAWSDERLHARVRDSLAAQRGADAGASDRLCSLLHYVSGDYRDAVVVAFDPRNDVAVLFHGTYGFQEVGQHVMPETGLRVSLLAKDMCSFPWVRDTYLQDGEHALPDVPWLRTRPIAAPARLATGT